MAIHFRKNFSSGVLRVQLNASAGYPDDPLYDELVVENDNTLPTTADGATSDDTFRLAIWDSNYTNPGDDPGLEIVTAELTVHDSIYQITERGSEGTTISAHPVGSNVGLHYTAGVSNEDLEPIIALMQSEPGSIIYAWEDAFGRKSIGVLIPSTYGKVLVTAGAGQRPFWDWVWGAPGATFGFLKVIEIEIFSAYDSGLVTLDYDELYTAEVDAIKNANAEDGDYEEVLEHVMDGEDSGIEMSAVPSSEALVFGTDSTDEQETVQSTSGNLATVLTYQIDAGAETEI